MPCGAQPCGLGITCATHIASRVELAGDGGRGPIYSVTHEGQVLIEGCRRPLLESCGSGSGSSQYVRRPIFRESRADELEMPTFCSRPPAALFADRRSAPGRSVKLPSGRGRIRAWTSIYAHCFAPGGLKAPLLKMSEAFEYFSESSCLKRFPAVNRSSPDVQPS